MEGPEVKSRHLIHQTGINTNPVHFKNLFNKLAAMLFKRILKYHCNSNSSIMVKDKTIHSFILKCRNCEYFGVNVKHSHLKDQQSEKHHL